MLELLDGNHHTPRSALCEWDGFNGKSPNEQVLKIVPVNSLTLRA